MIKQIFTFFLVLAAIFSLTAADISFAATPPLFEVATQQGTGVSKITLVKQLPGAKSAKTWQDIMAGVIRIVLAITGSLAFAAFTYGGVMMVTAQGNDDQIRKGKSLLFWAVFALVIIATSYAIVIGITQLKFFQ